MFPFSFWDELLRYSRLDNAPGFGDCLAGGPAEPRCSSSKQNRPARMDFLDTLGQPYIHLQVEILKR